jgi:hypothetical protein
VSGVADEIEIGPVASHRLYEDDEVCIWQMDVAPGETYPHHHHDHDYVLAYLSTWVGTTYDGEGDHDRIWASRRDRVPNEGVGAVQHEGSINFIEGDGFLSPGFVNVGDTTFTGGLVEVKRPRRPDQQGVGFARTDALVGVPPRPGRVNVLENDRVRTYVTTVLPGARVEVGDQVDAGVYVVEGGTVRIRQIGTDDDEQVDEVTAADHSGLWRPGGRARSIENLGAVPYRELSVELK